MIGCFVMARPFAVASPQYMLQLHQRVMVCAVRRLSSNGSNAGTKKWEVPIPATTNFSNDRKSATTTTTTAKSANNSWLWPAASIAAMGVTYMLMERTLHPANGGVVPSSTATPALPQAEITDRAYFDITIDGNAVGRIVLGLHGLVAPRTVENFLHLCQGDRYESVDGNIAVTPMSTRNNSNLRLSYEHSTFHRIIPSFMIQGGDFTRHNGTGGRSIFGRTFADETFALKHHVGVLSMANSGRNTNGSQFFITVAPTPHLDNSHVVFGTVLEGWEVVKAMEDCGSASGRPNGQVKIAACGILPKEQ